MPETSKRQKLVDAVITAMRRIRKANGFETDAGLRVRDFELNWQEDELPAISVCDVTQALAQEASSESHDLFRLNLAIRVSVSSGTRAAECRKMVADVMDAVRETAVSGELRWPVTEDAVTEYLAHGTEIQSADFILDEDSGRIAGVQVMIEILFSTKRFNAYE